MLPRKVLADSLQGKDHSPTHPVCRDGDMHGLFTR